MDAYHQGSLAVQARAGVREEAERVAVVIGTGIKPVAAAFLGLQPMLVVGAADEDGRMWSSLITGRPGFLRATGAHSVAVAGRAPDGDPLGGVLASGPLPVGTIALDPRTRRRMRLNGTARPTARGLAIEAERVFANCPKYIRRRFLEEPAQDASAATDVRRGERLTPGQEAFISAADTFFIASAAPLGVDASHRGGEPGFVRVESPVSLAFDDYPGNAMFLTLGNLEKDPRAGLLFLDWATGATLQVTGAARTEFAGRDRRTVRFAITGVVEHPHASPLRWSLA